jgi:hypothetical protein
MGPTIIVGVLTAQGLKGKPTNRGSAALSEQSEGRSDIKGA